jgi:hypothetical protein
MQLLTPSGYVDIDNLNIGDALIAYDVDTGEQIINHLEGKTLWTPNMYPEEGVEAHYDSDGNWVDYLLLSSSYQVFQRVQGDWKFYRINGTWNLYKDQSIWANLRVIHASELQIGDIIYNDLDQDIIVTSIEEVEQSSWWKLDVSGDSSYIADGLTLHNASRFWVGGGSSSNWNATGNTNWSSTSGGSNNASVPTSADDVTFNGNGNSNSTISAATTILSYTVTSGYTRTSTHNADLTVAGNVTLNTNYTIAGAGHMTISNTCTFNSNGKTWPNNLYFSTNTTTTLSSNLTIGGIWSTVGSVSPTINSSTTQTLTCNGIFFGNNCVPTGNTRFIIVGGSVTSQAIYGSFRNPVDFQGNVTMSANGYPIIFSDKNLRYISGNIQTSGSTLHFGGSAGLNLSGIQFVNVSFTALNTGANVTLSSSLFASGSVSGVGNINRSGSSATLIMCGSLAPFNNSLGGTAEIIHKGGSITTGASSTVATPLTLDGDITFVNNFLYYTGQFGGGETLKYLSGANNAGSTQLYLQSPCFLNTSPIFWGSLRVGGSFTPTFTLISDLNINGFTTASNVCNINTSSGSRLRTAGLIMSDTVQGTGTIELIGGTWSSSNFNVTTNLNFNGNVNLGANCNYQGKTISYISGIISGSLNITGNCTGSNFNKVPLERVVITNGTTMSLNEFFIGTPEKPAVIAASTTVGQYAIQFTDGFEKVSQDVNVYGCRLVRPLQLVLSNTKKLNSLKSNNVGIRYTNQSPNGFSKNIRKTPRNLPTQGLGLSSDPNFVKQA